MPARLWPPSRMTRRPPAQVLEARRDEHGADAGADGAVADVPAPLAQRVDSGHGHGRVAGLVAPPLPYREAVFMGRP